MDIIFCLCVNKLGLALLMGIAWHREWKQTDKVVISNVEYR